MKSNNFSSLKNTFIVAEVGNNHEGKLSNAYKLIDKAKDSGVDAVKFQTYDLKNFYSRDTDKKRIKQLKKFQLSHNSIIKLSKYAKKLGLVFFSTPLDVESAIFLNKVQKIFKISSGDNDFFKLIEKVLTFNKPIIISTGMMDFNTLKKLYDFIKKKKFKNQICFLHCVSSYPVPIKELNLNTIKFLKKKLPKCIIGYSDHSIGIEACINAAAMGAQIIEKHFTLSHNFSSFRDHQLSADPLELKELVRKIRNLEIMRGKFDKKIAFSEKLNKRNVRRSIASNKILRIGHAICESDLIMLRPGNGFSYQERKLIIGRKVKKLIKRNQIFLRGSLI